MGKARAKRQAHIKSSTNVVKLNNFLPKKQQSVDLLPRNRSQEEYILELLDSGKDIVFGIGPAGTGKTLLACQAAVKAFIAGEVDRIVVTRPAVSADEALGFLPVPLSSSLSSFPLLLFSFCREYFYSGEIESMIKEGVIEISPLAYMRGRTFKDAYIIADEMQNATPNQMKMLLTRIGTNSKMVVTGDLAQADRLKDNGLIEFIRHLEERQSDRISTVRFHKGDIERHEAVKEVLAIYGDV